MIAGVSDLSQVGQDGLGVLFEGALTADGRAVRVRMLQRRLTDGELRALRSPLRAAPPAAGLAPILDVGMDVDMGAYVVIDAGAYVVIDADVTASLADRRAARDWLSQDVNDTAQLRVAISQPIVGATAAGSWSGTCAGSAQHWRTVAEITDGRGLVAGCARGSGLAVVARYGTTVERFTWRSQLALAGPHGAGTSSPGGC